MYTYAKGIAIKIRFDSLVCDFIRKQQVQIVVRQQVCSLRTSFIMNDSYQGLILMDESDKSGYKFEILIALMSSESVTRR